MGRTPHTKTEASLPQENTGCARCPCPADGYDAQAGEARCKVCAKARADGGEDIVFRVECTECDGWDSIVAFTRRMAAEADVTRHNRKVHDREDGPANVQAARVATDGGQGSCPNCSSELHKTGNPTPGNTPEKKCRSCGWLNWHGRPERTAPPYDE